MQNYKAPSLTTISQVSVLCTVVYYAASILSLIKLYSILGYMLLQYTYYKWLHHTYAYYYWARNRVTTLLPAYLGGKPALNSIVIDSGCSKSLFCNKDYLINLRVASRTSVQGINGTIHVTEEGDFPFNLTAKNGIVHEKLIKGCLYSSECNANLLSVSDLTDAGIDVKFTQSHVKLGYRVDEDDNYHISIYERIDKIYCIPPIFPKYSAYLADMNKRFIYRLGAAELWHLRLGHAHFEKIAKLSKRCIGISQPISHTK